MGNMKVCLNIKFNNGKFYRLQIQNLDDLVMLYIDSTNYLGEKFNNNITYNEKKKRYVKKR